MKIFKSQIAELPKTSDRVLKRGTMSLVNRCAFQNLENVHIWKPKKERESRTTVSGGTNRIAKLLWMISTKDVIK